MISRALVLLQFNMTGFEIALVFVLGLLSIYFTLNKTKKNLPPGAWGFPLVGHLPLLGSQPYKTLKEWGKSMGPVMYIKMGSFPCVVINDAKIIKETLNGNAATGRPAIKFFADRTGGGQPKGIIFSDGTAWMEQRRFTLKTLRDFGFGRKSMETIISEEANELTERLKRDAGKPMSIQNAFNAAILNALWSILTGERFQQDDPELAKALHLLTNAIHENNTVQGVATFLPWIGKWFPNMSGYNNFLKDVPDVTAFVFKTIKPHEETFQEGIRRDFLDVYIEEVRKTTDPKSQFHKSNSEMEYVLLDLFVAGTETTSTSLGWTLLYLAKHRQVQKRLHQEIDKIVGNSRQPALVDRAEMPYAQAILHEVMRYSSFIPFSVFHNTTQDTLIGGYNVPKNTMIIPNIYAVHHDEKIWTDPENFRPERFIDDKGEFQKNDNFMIFSTGKRVCLGENLARDEYFLFLTSIFQRFEVSVEGDINFEPFVGMILSPKPHNFIFKERT